MLNELNELRGRWVRAGLAGAAAGVVTLSGGACWAQAEAPAERSALDMSSKQWCRDTATFCWSDQRVWFPGVRIVGEPNFGYLLQGGGDQFEPTTLIGTAKLGVNISIVGAWAALELTVIPPFTSNLTDTSKSVTEMQLVKGGDSVAVDYGLAFGGALFDGVLSVGGGFLSYNDNQFVRPQKIVDGFVYIALNPISALRSTVTRAR